MSEVAAVVDKKEKKTSDTGSIAGSMLVFIGLVVAIIGIIYGLVAGQDAPYGMAGEIIFGVWAATVLPGMLIAGFGTIINLLREINNNLLNM